MRVAPFCYQTKRDGVLWLPISFPELFFSRSNHDLWICSITSRWNEAGLRQTKNRFFTSRVSNIHWEKSVRIWSLSVLYFLAFGLNTERYLISFRIQSKCGKIRTRKLQIRTLFTQWLIYTIKKKLSHFDKFQKWRAFTTSLNGSKIQANVINTNNWGKMHLLGHHLTWIEKIKDIANVSIVFCLA